MGCGSSSTPDVKKVNNRKRLNSTEDPADKVRDVRSSTPITMPGAGKQSKDSEDNQPRYGTSFTDRKTQEYNLLRNIVTKTRHHFIAAHGPSGLDKAEAGERSNVYVTKLSRLKQEDVLSSLFGFPAALIDTTISTSPGVLPSAIFTALGNARISQQDAEYMKECNSIVRTGVNSFEMRDTKKPLVLTFDELE